MEFLDTSTIIEFVAGRVRLEGEYCTLDLNLAELYYVILRNSSAEDAQKYFEVFSSIACPLTREIIPEAMSWRRLHAKLDFSYADALGYTYALRKGIVFITLDRSFKGMPGVKMIG